MSRKSETCLWGDVVSGPDHLQLSDAMVDSVALAAWVDRLREFRAAMEPLGRVVILGHDDDPAGIWVGSVAASEP